MYESMTYEEILKRMLDRVPNTMDKREGSIIYDALAPVAMELKLAYIELDQIISESFADTESRPFLIKRCAERGIAPREKTNAILLGAFTPENIDVTGQRFSLGKLNYIATQKLSDGKYQMQCEVGGTEGNRYRGALIPIDYVDGLETAELIDLLIPAEDDEPTEELRQRYFDSFNSQAFGGNIADYKEKLAAIDGVGGRKVYRCFDGGGTVKIVITASDYSAPSEVLVEKVQEIIDPKDNKGEGVGVAPILHIVTVEGCNEEIIDIQTHITFQDGWTWDNVLERVAETVDTYFKQLSMEWENTENLIVRISQIEARLLTIPGVLDVSETLLNGKENNITVDSDSIPVRGGIVNV